MKGEFIGIDCQLKPNCSDLEYEGGKTHQKVYFKNLKKIIASFMGIAIGSDQANCL